MSQLKYYFKNLSIYTWVFFAISMGIGYIIIYMPILSTLSTYVELLLNPHIISMDKNFTWTIKFKSFGCSNVFQM
jgi:hypothetical protein